MWFTTLGTGTMYAFLLHTFVQRSMIAAGWYAHPFWHGPAGQLVLSASAVALALLLCTAPVRTLFRPLVEPRLRCLLRPAEQDPGRPPP